MVASGCDFLTGKTEKQNSVVVVVVFFLCRQSYHFKLVLFMSWAIFPRTCSEVIFRSNECLTLAKLSVKTFVDGLFFAVIDIIRG